MVKHVMLFITIGKIIYFIPQWWNMCLYSSPSPPINLRLLVTNKPTLMVTNKSVLNTKSGSIITQDFSVSDFTRNGICFHSGIWPKNQVPVVPYTQSNVHSGTAPTLPKNWQFWNYAINFSAYIIIDGSPNSKDVVYREISVAAYCCMNTV